jgi:arsenate reductase
VEDKIKVLFLSTGDTARCEMAEGFLHSLGGDRFIAVSASTEPDQATAEAAPQAPAEATAKKTAQTPAPTVVQSQVQSDIQNIDPSAIEVMKEIGIDISQQRTKPVTEVFKDHFAYVVGVCETGKERCPVFPFTYELLQWNIEDPADEQKSQGDRLATFRRVRDSIGEKIRELIANVSKKVAPRAAVAGRSH